MTKYEVTLEGFTVNNETWDHILEVDGKRDEVYIYVDTRLFDQGGNSLLTTEKQTPVMGDTNGFKNRVKAGSASSKGGLMSGDHFPYNNPWQRQGNLNIDRPPMLLWKGELTDNIMAIITPTIWEWDGGTDLFTEWSQAIVDNGPAITDAVIKMINVFKTGGVLPTDAIKGSLDTGLPALRRLLNTILGQAGDRPIGMVKEGNNLIFKPKSLVINKKVAEIVVNHDYGYGPGVIGIRYQDDSTLAGNYMLYLKVKRVENQVVVNWEDLGGTTKDAPAVCSWASNRLDCFIRGTDNHMWHKWYDGSGWSHWEDLGGTLTSAPTAVSWGPNRIDCFVRGTNNSMWHKWWDGSKWSHWEDLGGTLTSAPAVSSWAPNRLDCFVRGTNNSMWHKWWDGSKWSHWEDLGGTLTSAPTAVSWGPNRIDCFVRGTDNHMWHKWWDGSKWSHWEDLGGTLQDAPAVCSWASGRLDCFIRGTDNHMWHKWYDGSGWSHWEDLGDTIISAPAAVSWGPNRIDCFARGTNDHMWHKWM